MKNTKDILLLILFMACGLLAYFAFFTSNPEYKKKVKELQTANDILKLQRDSLDKDIAKLQGDYNTIKAVGDSLDKEIVKLDAEIKKNKAAAALSQGELDKVRKDLAGTRKKIDELKKNPPNRTGDDLLNSLKIKTKQ